MIAGVKIANLLDRRQAQRIQFRHLVATHTVVVDQPQYRRLFLGGPEIKISGCRYDWRNTVFLGQLFEATPHRTLWFLHRSTGHMQAAKIGPPVVVHRIRIIEIVLVQVLDIGSVETLNGG